MTGHLNTHPKVIDAAKSALELLRDVQRPALQITRDDDLSLTRAEFELQAIVNSARSHDQANAIVPAATVN